MQALRPNPLSRLPRALLPRRQYRRGCLLSAALLLAVAALALGCQSPGSQHPSQSSATPSGDSGVKGVVITWPVCPVEGGSGKERQDGCQGTPTAATVQVRDQSTQVVVSTLHSGQDGQFEESLRPGAYVITAHASGTSFCHAVNVAVHPGEYTEVTVVCDTGLR